MAAVTEKPETAQDPSPDERAGAIATRQRGFLRRAGTWIVRVMSRVLVTVQRKLLVALVGIVVLLMVIGILGIRVLGQSNARVESLGRLQIRTAAYQQLQTGTNQLRVLVALRAGGDAARLYSGAVGSSALSSWTAIDDTIESTLKGLGVSLNSHSLGFVPSTSDKLVLDSIKVDYVRFSEVINKISAFDAGGNAKAGQSLQHSSGEPLANDLVTLTQQLVDTTKQETNALIARNTRSYANSQHLFIAVAIASILLAILLGYALSWSLIGPIRRMGDGLAAIAAGDFSRHVDVRNRDELGALAINLNRMNDELGRLYSELETASRHKSEFLANMSHELRTPLNAIIGFSEVLGERMFGDLNERQAEYISDIVTSGRHLLSLINDILDLAKVEAGRMELDLGPVPIAATLDSGMMIQRERAAQHGIVLSLDVASDVPDIEADERKVRQIVFNLLSNAVKFTPDGGHIDVIARASNNHVEIAVSDTGVGIAPEDLERIFEEFQQTDSGKKVEGTGLGLALSRRFVELHGGHMWVESILGSGSTFRFSLPVRQS